MEFKGLSLFGKVTIVKSFLIPKLLYVSTILETPQEIIKQMERMLNIFRIVNVERIDKRNTLFHQICHLSKNVKNERINIHVSKNR